MDDLKAPPVVAEMSGGGAGAGGRMPRWIYSVVVMGILGLSGLMFSVSLVTNCYYTGTWDRPVGSIGIMLLLLGWAALMDGMVAWFANPLLFLAWLCVAVRPLRWGAAPLAGLAFLVALTFLLHGTILRDEGGGRTPIIGYGVGYWLWLGSMVVTGLGGLVILFLRPEKFGTLFGKRG